MSERPFRKTSYRPGYRYVPPGQFRGFTRIYDTGCRITCSGRHFKKRILAKIDLSPGETVLDVGCATGTLLRLIGKDHPGVRLVGLDPSEEALRMAAGRLRKDGVEAELWHGFAESLPLDDESVDVCVSTQTFHHMPDSAKRQAMKEIYRVLRPGGRVFIADFGEEDRWWVRKMAFLERAEYTVNMFSGLIRETLAEAGFKGTRVLLRQFPAMDLFAARK